MPQHSSATGQWTYTYWTHVHIHYSALYNSTAVNHHRLMAALKHWCWSVPAHGLWLLYSQYAALHILHAFYHCLFKESFLSRTCFKNSFDHFTVNLFRRSPSSPLSSSESSFIVSMLGEYHPNPIERNSSSPPTLRNVFYPSIFGAFYVYFQPVSPARTA